MQTLLGSYTFSNYSRRHQGERFHYRHCFGLYLQSLNTRITIRGQPLVWCSL